MHSRRLRLPQNKLRMKGGAAQSPHIHIRPGFGGSPSVGVQALSLGPRSPRNCLKTTDALGEIPSEAWSQGPPATSSCPELSESPSEGAYPPLLHSNFSILSHLPSPAPETADEFVRQIYIHIEYLLVPGTIHGLKERVGGGEDIEALGKPPGPALHFQPWLALRRAFPHSLHLLNIAQRGPRLADQLP